MSERDREKWNARYREGAYAERPHPSWLVERWAPRIRAALVREPQDQDGRSGGSGAPELRALDVACGAGRNALWLAGTGFRVDAVDVAQAGLDRARLMAAERGLAVDWHCVDLDDGMPAELDGYDLIVVVRYLNRALMPLLPMRLRPGGHLIAEIHLATDAPVAGPASAAFRVAPGELARLLPGLEILECVEDLVEDVDGRPAALARLVGVRAG